MAQDTAKLHAMVDRIDKLPTLPVVVTQILSLVESPETSAVDVNRVISTDQALAAKVLKLVNSPFYGFSRQISTVTQAVVILGFRTIKSLALSATVFEIFGGRGTQRFDRQEFWKHSIGTGVAAQIIAKKMRYPLIEEAFIAGIVHDLGKVVLDQFLPDDFARVLAWRDDKGSSLRAAEKAVLGVDHAAIGGWLAERWKLPPALLHAIAWHHDATKAENTEVLPAIIYLADLLARTRGIGNGGDTVIPDLQEAVWERLQLDQDDLEGILRDLERDMHTAQDFIVMTQTARA